MESVTLSPRRDSGAPAGADRAPVESVTWLVPRSSAARSALQRPCTRST